jgi:hypothetical protein
VTKPEQSEGVEMTAKERVLAVWPDARAVAITPGKWLIAHGDDPENLGYALLGPEFRCKAEAWQNAAESLPPQPEQEVNEYAEPVKIEGKHRFMAGTCVDCGKPLTETCIPLPPMTKQVESLPPVEAKEIDDPLGIEAAMRITRGHLELSKPTPAKEAKAGMTDVRRYYVKVEIGHDADVVLATEYDKLASKLAAAHESMRVLQEAVTRWDADRREMEKELAAYKLRVERRESQLAAYNKSGFADSDAMADAYLNAKNELTQLQRVNVELEKLLREYRRADYGNELRCDLCQRTDALLEGIKVSHV